MLYGEKGHFLARSPEMRTAAKEIEGKLLFIPN